MRNHFGKSHGDFAPAVPTEVSDLELTRKWRIHEPVAAIDEAVRADFDDEYKKSSRTCKGKRYQEIMKSISKNGSPNKRLKTKHNAATSGASGMENGFRHFDVGAVGMEVDVKDVSLEDQKDIDKKMFDASDFDLEEKIRALPALSLDEYLARKRETKKTKKKLGGKGRHFSFFKKNYGRHFFLFWSPFND